MTSHRCEISPSFDLVNSATVLLTLGPQWAIVLGERPPGWAYFLGGSGGTNTTEARRQHVCNDKIMEKSQKMLHTTVWQRKLASFYIEIESLVEALHFSFSLSDCQSVYQEHDGVGVKQLSWCCRGCLDQWGVEIRQYGKQGEEGGEAPSWSSSFP